MKLKTKSKLKGDLEITNKMITILKVEKETLETKFEILERDFTNINRLISDIGFIIFGADWQQSHSRKQLFDAIENLKMQSNLNAGMFHGMKEAHRVVLDKLSTELRKQNFKEGV